jgi:hypothetical protein
MDERELARKNNRFGLLLFVIALLIFAATIGVAYLYLALD